MIIVYLNKILFFLYSLLFLLTPLIVLPLTSELFEFNKIIFIYLTATLILFLWLMKMIIYKKIIVKKTPFDIVFFLFLLSQLLSTIFSINRHTSIFGFYGRFNGGLLSLIVYFILYYGLVSNLTKNQIKKILQISLFIAILTVLIGLPAKLNHDLLCLVFTGEKGNNCWTEQFKPSERMFSTLGQPNWFGAYLAVNFFIALYYFFKKNNHQSLIENLKLIFPVGIIFIGILFSRSRSAFISTISLTLLALLVLYALKYLKKAGQQIKNIYNIKFLILFIFLFLLVAIFKTGINQIDRYLNFERNNSVNIKPPSAKTPILVTESLDIRKIVWRGAIELGKKYPLFGTGVETFGYSYYFTRPKEHNLTSEWDYLYNRAHNEYLNFLATTGFFGLGSYLLMIFFILYFFIKYLLNHLKEKNEDEFFLIFFLLLGYLSILITNFFGFSTSTISLFFYLIPGIILVIKKNEPTEKNESFNFSLKKLFFLGLTSIIFLYMVIKIINYWLADYNYAKGEQYSKLGYYQEAINSFNQALKLKYEHVYEDKVSTNLAILAFIAANQNEKLLAKKLISLSIFFNEKSLQANPKNVLYLKSKAKNHYLYFQTVLDKKFLIQGADTLLSAHHLAPTEPKIIYNLALFNNLLSEIEQEKEEKERFINKSLKYINLAVNLKPNYRDAFFLKSQLLKKKGDNEGAKKILKFILEKINSQDQEVKKELESI